MPLKIGITGHQQRDGIDWRWVSASITRAIANVGDEVIGLSSLAAGSDQVFARCVLASGGALITVVPKPNYEELFKHPEDLEAYRMLSAQSKIVSLTAASTDERSFLNAGEWIVNHSDRIFAVWDGEHAEGVGGTADVVDYARTAGKPILQLNPISLVVQSLGH